MYPLPSSTLPSPPLLPSLLPSSPLPSSPHLLISPSFLLSPPLPSFPPLFSPSLLSPPPLPSSPPPLLLSSQEQSRNSRLQLEVEGGMVSQQALTELQEMVADLRAEKELLKQTNERLVKR